MTPDLNQLARTVTDRRHQLGLSVLRAATLASISKDTWARVEGGQPVRHMTYEKIEAVLGWAAGSCRKIMGGGEAVLLDDIDTGARITVVPPDALEAGIRDAVQGALIASTDDLTAAQIREVNERAIAVLRERGILPPKA